MSSVPKSKKSAAPVQATAGLEFLIGLTALAIFGYFLFKGIGAVSGIFSSGSSEKSSWDYKPSSDIRAVGCASDELRKILKSPSSFDLQAKSVNITSHGNDEYGVTGEFDAQNGFGATIRNSFRCEVSVSASNVCLGADCSIY